LEKASLLKIILTFQKIDYIHYLEKFDQLYEIPRETTKKTGAYRDYVNSMLNYVIDFIKRAKPLTNVEGLIQKADEVIYTSIHLQSIVLGIRKQMARGQSSRLEQRKGRWCFG
jgi:hypothetical protein